VIEIETFKDVQKVPNILERMSRTADGLIFSDPKSQLYSTMVAESRTCTC
jgi:hypothetical protein